MGRRKLEIRRIEDKSSRSVAFSKRRSGLVKKAHHLSVLCDVDVAVIVFSAGGKLYEFSNGGGATKSVDDIISRYQKRRLEVGEITTYEEGEDLCKKFGTCQKLQQAVDRLVDDYHAEEFSVSDMTQLEQELDATLVQTRLRKTQLMMEYISTLQEKETKLTEEKQELEKQLVATAAASAEDNNNIDVDDGGGGLNNLATNQINSPQLITLPLFNG